MTEEKEPKTEFILSNAPHTKDEMSLRKVMWFVVIALMPSVLFSVHLYGISAAKLMIASIIAAVLAEVLFQFLMKRTITVTDGSAVITGMLLAMNIPPEAPVWMVVIGSFFAIIIVKQLFGGLGFNIFNPALAARAFMLASWPVHMTTRWYEFSPSNVLASDIKNISGIEETAFDVVTQATPLGALKEVPKLLSDMNLPLEPLYDLLLSKEMLMSLFIGDIGGCIGETSVLFLLIGGAFLLYKRIITWHIPLIYIGTFATIILLYYTLTDFPYPFKVTLFHLLSGGLMLGAFFMATDMVTTPVTAKGMIIFGIGCGVIASVIRLWGGYPEGVSYSILLMNAVVPLIDKYTKPRVFGVNDKE
ncbi:MAG: RnfABCDGE type electron transport complex subunit D [Spirochaetota bacterium]|nr:RnfABCDGE type electron transport complex subunit D [Spirochaetota bacterium]